MKVLIKETIRQLKAVVSANITKQRVLNNERDLDIEEIIKASIEEYSEQFPDVETILANCSYEELIALLIVAEGECY